MMDVPEDIRKQAVYYVGMMFAGVTLGKDIDRAAKIIEEARGFFTEALLSERLAQKERDATIADSFPATVLQFWDRPGGPPGNGVRPSTSADVAAAIRQS